MLFFVKNFKKCAGVLDGYVEQFFKIFLKKERKNEPPKKMLNSYVIHQGTDTLRGPANVLRNQRKNTIGVNP